MLTQTLKSVLALVDVRLRAAPTLRRSRTAVQADQESDARISPLGT
jgi:hypothetical protein